MQFRHDPASGKVTPIFTKTERNKMLTALHHIDLVPDPEVKKAVAVIRERMPLLGERQPELFEKEAKP